MRDSVVHIIEAILGAFLIGLGLIYLQSQQEALRRLTDIINQHIIEDKKVYQQYNVVDINLVSDKEVYAALMGYREYPIMIDDNIVPLNGREYDLYFTYIKKGYYKKEYKYEANRRIAMILYTYVNT